jgi:hypothetical protein
VVVYLTWCLEGLAGAAAAGHSLGEAGFAAAHTRLAGRPPPELIAAATREEQS